MSEPKEYICDTCGKWHENMPYCTECAGLQVYEIGNWIPKQPEHLKQYGTLEDMKRSESSHILKIRCNECNYESFEIHEMLTHTCKPSDRTTTLQSDVKRALNQAVKSELTRANILFPLFHSAHEAESVIREELEECMEELNNIQAIFLDLWDNVKANDLKQQEGTLKGFKRSAEALSIEVIQLRAMLEKAQLFYDVEGRK